MARIILTTGGTGGHIFPALAVAESLLEESPRTELLFIGSLHGPEHRLVRQAGIRFAALRVRGFMGRGWRMPAAAAQMAIAVGRSLRILAAFRPDVVAGFGGYASFAPVFAAKMMRIPSVIHEQNAVAGSCNRILGRLARRVCVSLPHTEGFPVGRCVETGNPVRASMYGIGPARGDSPHQRRRLLVLGGSQGAHALNSFICSVLPALRSGNVDILHQSGVGDLETVRSAYARAGYDPSCVAPFFDDMPERYAWADMAICRSGASTVGELCATGLPALLVPFPFAIRDHQTCNARILEQAGAARILPEDSLMREGLEILSGMLFQDGKDWAAMSRAALRCARPDAARAVAATIMEVARKGSQSAQAAPAA